MNNLGRRLAAIDKRDHNQHQFTSHSDGQEALLTLLLKEGILSDNMIRVRECFLGLFKRYTVNPPVAPRLRGIQVNLVSIYSLLYIQD